jgi:transposase
MLRSGARWRDLPERYRRRWKIERTISWISSFRRLIVRHQYYSFMYQGFIHLACIMICLRRF